MAFSVAIKIGTGVYRIYKAAKPIVDKLIRDGVGKRATPEAVRKQIETSGKEIPQIGKQTAQRLANKAKEVDKGSPKEVKNVNTKSKTRINAQAKKAAERTAQASRDRSDQQKISDRISQKNIVENIGKSRVPAKRNQMVVREGTELTKPKSPPRPKPRPTPQANNLINRQTLTGLEGLSKDMEDEKKQETTPEKIKPIKKTTPTPPKKTKPSPKPAPKKTTKADDPTEGGRYAFYPGQTSKDLGLMYEVDRNKMSDEVRERLEEAEDYEGDSKGGRVGKGKKKKVSKAPRGVRAALRGFKPNIGASKGNKRTRGTGGGWV